MIIIFNILNHVIIFSAMYYIFNFRFIVIIILLVSSGVINLFVWLKIFKNTYDLESERVDFYLTVLLTINFPALLFYLSTKHNGKAFLISNNIDNYSEMIGIKQEHQKIIGCFEYCIKYMKYSINTKNIENGSYRIDNSKDEISAFLKMLFNKNIIRSIILFIILGVLLIVFREFLLQHIKVVSLFALILINSIEGTFIIFIDYLKLKSEFKKKNFTIFTVLLFASFIRYFNVLFSPQLKAVYEKIKNERL